MVPVATARTLARELLAKSDRSAYVLAEYMPAAARDLFLGLRAFNVKTQQVVDTATDRKLARLRLEFWKGGVQEVHAAAAPDEPVLALLHDVARVQQLPVAKRYLLTAVQTRDARLALAPLRSLEDMERWGEGTASQVHYALLDGLHAVWPDSAEYLAMHPELDEKVTHVCAHLGQAAGVAGLLRTFGYYANKHAYVNLPVDLLAQAGVPTQAVLDAAETGPQALAAVDGLADVVFAAATRANDHILAARSIVDDLRARVGVPPAVQLIGMTALPTTLYLEQLERNNFELGRPVGGEWKLAWRSWLAWRRRRF